jgi:hypothetical protein
MFAYAFPPFRFLAPVLHKITGEKCRIIVIAPARPKQAWFANLLVKNRGEKSEWGECIGEHSLPR